MLKDFQELTIKDAFMFAAVMTDEETCRRFLEMALGMKISRVTVVDEKRIAYHSEYHGIRLDVFAEERGTKRRFNVEMQVKSFPSLPRRTRYYHSQMDMDALAAGADYNQLPNTYVIFICDFLPFNGESRLYRYTFHSKCEENGCRLEDGRTTMFLSTKGENADDVPKELVRFLKYVEQPDVITPDVETDVYVRSLERQVAAIKRSRDWEARFVLMRELMQKERREGRLERSKEVVIKVLTQLGDVPEEIQQEIAMEEDESVLDEWLLIAARASSIENFKEQL